jgi:hypothetical protein
VMVGRWCCLYTWYKFAPSHLSPDEVGRDGLPNAGLLSTTDTATYPSRIYWETGILHSPQKHLRPLILWSRSST